MAKDTMSGEGRYFMVLVDYGAEIRRATQLAPSLANRMHWDQLAKRQLIADGFLPSCFDLEHRDGICPHGHQHPMHEVQGKNTIVQALRASVTNQMTGNAAPTNLLITQVAIGTSADPTAASMVQLVAEFFRKAPTDRLNPTPDQVQIYANLTASEGNAPSNLQEFGIMAGGASGIAGSGTMLARFLQNFPKNSGNTASISYLATFA